jgi:N-acetylglucosamine-6-sulfatase
VCFLAGGRNATAIDPVLKAVPWRRLIVALAFASLGAGAFVGSIQAASPSAGPSAIASPSARASHQPPVARHAALLPSRPNIVFVLTDDLSMNLLQYMPQVQAMERRGLTFNNYFVSDSLCCPSRSSILTGNFPHDTDVFGNLGPHGGFHVFYERGEEQHTFAVALQRAGYRTALMGKYLNGYLQTQGGDPNVPKTYVPPGWNEWDVAGWGYPEYDYQLNEDGTLVSYGHQPSDYLTDVLAGKGLEFINQSAAAGKPFFLELATFAPHSPYTPAPRDASDFPGVRAPQGPNFNVLPANPPSWLAGRPALTSTQINQINQGYRLRAQAVQAVDDMIGRIEGALAANGLTDDTYLVFSSDNGLHMGEYRLMPGKMTAFDSDIHVPLVVVGPGVPAAQSTDAMVENIDLAKTFTAIGGTNLPGDGHSLLPLLEGQQPTDWRNAILVEHHGPDVRGVDPDFQQPASGNPTTYEAMRTRDFLYVEYKDGEREFYDLRSDPDELDNLAGRLTTSELAVLHSELLGIEHCHTGSSCWAAMHVVRGFMSPARARRSRRR